MKNAFQLFVQNLASACKVYGIAVIAFVLLRLLAYPAGNPVGIVSSNSAAEVVGLMKRVSAYQQKKYGGHPLGDWQTGTFYSGVMTAYNATGEKAFFNDAKAWCESAHWRLPTNSLNADQYCTGQTFLDVYFKEKNPEMIRDLATQSEQLFNHGGVLRRAAMGGYAIWEEPTRPFAGSNLWWWCDSLYMAPPVLARMSAATGDPKYRELLNTLYWSTVDYLYDTNEHLFFRDEHAFGKTTPSGKKPFWSRGNGWVFGGLVRVLDYLPENDPMRAKYLNLFRELAASLVRYQQADGMWRSSLNDPAWFPTKESSGSSFFCFGLAAGVNRGWLDREVYKTPALKAWAGLVGCVSAEGKIGYAQRVAGAPGAVRPEDSIDYASGAFLLAASEIYKLAGGGHASADGTDDCIKIIGRYREILMSNVSQEETNSSRVTAWIASLNADGTWPDINYANADRASWKVGGHLERIRRMAHAFVDARDPLYQDAKVEAATLRALDYWLANRFKCPNWWWNQIGVPELMRDIIILLDDKLSDSRRTGALEVLAQCGNPKNGQGANTIWMADLALHHAALVHDVDAFAASSRIIDREIKITNDDGIQADYSFHQHSSRLQQFQYGRAYLNTTARLARQLRGTRWEIPRDKLQILASYAMDGSQWMCRGIYTVPSTLDRSVSRPRGLSQADMRAELRQLAELLPERATEFNGIIARQDGRGQPLVGVRVFPQSDFATYHRSAFSFFVKTLSDRTWPAEVNLNGENLKGGLQGCGDYYLLRDGREYLDLAPVWDWNLLPGVTFGKGAGKPQRRSFVGAVSDGQSCAVTMDCGFGRVDTTTLSARKLWACHGDVIVALIADLNATDLDQPVRTALDQCLQRGEVTVPNGNNGTVILPEGDHKSLDVAWVHHAGFAYAPLNGLRMSVRIGPASGTWKSINHALSPAPVTARIFLPVLEHGTMPSAQNGGFIVVSGTATEAVKLFKKPVWEVLRNDADVQAVRFDDGTVIACFHRAGAVKSGGRPVLGVDAPCLLLARARQISICDPSQRGGIVHVRIGDHPEQGVKLPRDGGAGITGITF